MRSARQSGRSRDMLLASRSFSSNVVCAIRASPKVSGWPRVRHFLLVQHSPAPRLRWSTLFQPQLQLPPRFSHLL